MERLQNRPSKIETLPAEADPAVLWAAEMLREQRMTQLAILPELNRRLAALGIGETISRSALNRFAMRLKEGLVPPRFRGGSGGMFTIAPDFEAALVRLIDERIAAALRGRP